jgi:hypothetical protein
MMHGLELVLDLAWVLFVLVLVAKPNQQIPPDRELEAQVDLADQLIEACTPKYAASKQREDYTVIPVSEFAGAVSRAKQHDLETASAAWLRQQCRRYGIEVGDRGRIPKWAIAELATKL